MNCKYFLLFCSCIFTFLVSFDAQKILILMFLFFFCWLFFSILYLFILNVRQEARCKEKAARNKARVFCILTALEKKRTGSSRNNTRKEAINLRLPIAKLYLTKTITQLSPLLANVNNTYSSCLAERKWNKFYKKTAPFRALLPAQERQTIKIIMNPKKQDQIFKNQQ